MVDAQANFPLFPYVDWRIDGPLQRRPTDQLSATHLVYCSPRQGYHSRTHIAKLLPGEATEEQWLCFERQAYLAVKLSTTEFQATYCRLTPPCAMLVYPRLQGLRLDDWVNHQPQWVARAVWVALACQLLVRLEAFHKLGYVHGQIYPEHVWIDNSGHPHLLGMGRCAAVGEPLGLRTTGTGFDAPELQRADSETTSAQDIYSMAAIIDLTSGGLFAKTPVGQCMQAACPYDRPTAGELVELFRSYQHELSGGYVYPSARAA